MDKTETMESEIKELFNITDDEDAPVDTTPTETEPTSNTDTEPNQDADNSDSDTDAEASKNQTAETNTEKTPDTNDTDNTPLNPEEKFNKQNSAFAQMRIQNKELTDLLMTMAKATGQNPKNITEAQSLLKDNLNKVISKNRNIPEDVLQEMEADKKALAEFKQAQVREKALAGFRQVKSKFNLSQDELNAFTDRLIENKLNPFEKDMDLEKEYKNLYFDELIAKAIEDGVQQERARSIKAQQNSTTPSTQQGVTENTGNQDTPIKTVKALDELLDSVSGKK